jgi:hypothetical protein
MGLFVSTFIGIILLLLMGEQLLIKNNTIEMLNDNEKFSADNTVRNKIASTENYQVVEAEKALIRTCQMGQSWVLNCKKCYTAGNAVCPYPTDAFCQSAKATDMTDTTIFCGFLPNNNGHFSEIRNGATINKNTITNVSQMGMALRGELNRVYDYTNTQNYNYTKPSGANTDVCAFSSIVGN